MGFMGLVQRPLELIGKCHWLQWARALPEQSKDADLFWDVFWFSEVFSAAKHYKMNVDSGDVQDK